MPENKNFKTMTSKLTPIEKTLLKEAGQTLTVRNNGINETLTFEELLVKTKFKTALNGSPHAQNQLSKSLKQTQEKNQKIIDLQCARAKKYKSIQEKELAHALENKLDKNSVLPHPDDFIIDEGTDDPTKAFTVNGPLDEDELKIVLEDCAIRDQLLLQDTLEQRFILSETANMDLSQQFPDIDDFRISALVAALLLNAALPIRFQLSDIEIKIEIIQRKYNKRSKRELLKDTFNGWKNLGKPKPRGWLSPLVADIATTIQKIKPVLEKVQKADNEKKPVSKNELAKLIFHALN